MTNHPQHTEPAQAEPTPIDAPDGATRKLLGARSWPGGRTEFVHQFDDRGDTFQRVIIREGQRRPHVENVHRREAADFRAALDAFETSVRERHASLPTKRAESRKPWEPARFAPGKPRGAVTPPKEDR